MVTQTTTSPDTTTTIAAQVLETDAAALEKAQQTMQQSRSPRAFDPFEDFSYDPAAINAYYRRRPFQIVGRLFTIIWPFLFFFAQVWWNRRGGVSEATQRKQAKRLREMLTNLGPAYIKIGQALSTRPDLVPPIYLDELTRLQDQLPPFSNEVAFRYIEEELGAPPAEIYDDLSRQHQRRDVAQDVARAQHAAVQPCDDGVPEECSALVHG